MTLLDFVRLIRHNLWMLVLASLVGVGAMALYSWRQPPVYQTTSTAYVTGTSFTSNTDSTKGSLANSYVPFASSLGTAKRIIEATKVNMTPGQVAGSLSAVVVPDSYIMKISAKASTPEEAQKIANAAPQAMAQEAAYLDSLGGNKAASSASTNAASPTVPVQNINLQRINDAGLPTVPSSPNWTINLLIGAVAGFVLGVIISMIRRFIDVRIRTQADVEELTGKSVLSVIPRVADLKAQRDTSATPETTDLGIASEPLRRLRTNLKFLNVDNPPRAVVITSANPGEGKSMVASNLARVLAEAGHKTIILDCDLRRPMQAKTFNIDGNLGVAQVLAGEVDIDDAALQTAVPGLTVVPAGRIPPNPSELVGSARMHRLIDSLKETHTVIIDAPPLLPVVDASLLSVASDGALVVAAVGKTHKEHLRRCAKLLQQVNGQLLGSVINMAPERGIGSVYYGYGYGYGYGDNYYYYDKAGKKKRRGKKAAADPTLADVPVPEPFEGGDTLSAPKAPGRRAAG